MMSWLSSGEDIVWAATPNGDLWYRNGVDASNPMGLNWYKVRESFKEIVLVLFTNRDSLCLCIIL